MITVHSAPSPTVLSSNPTNSRQRGTEQKGGMSVATSIPCIRLPTTTTTTSSSSSSSGCSSTSFKLSHAKPSLSFTIRCSQTEGPIRRPMAPSPSPTPVKDPSLTPLQPPSSPPPKPALAAAVVEDKSLVTLEFQRSKAKELQDYFKLKKLEQADQGPVFGFLPKNEINNGRHSKMFDFDEMLLRQSDSKMK